MSYCAYITRIKNLRKHTNADRLMVGQCFGSNVIVSLSTQDDELGVYFPTDGRLCEQYCVENDLLRRKDENGNQAGGFLDPEKRKIQAIKLRGEQSDGLFMPLKSLEKFTNIAELKEGDSISVLNGMKICEKYIPRGSHRSGSGGGSKPKTKKIETSTFPLFYEHSDTAQLAYNMNQFREGDNCVITLKMHGTSQRTSHTIKEERKVLPSWLYMISKTLKILPKPKKAWDYVCGTRRVVLKNMAGGFYGSNDFRQRHHDRFIGKLQKGVSR